MNKNNFLRNKHYDDIVNFIHFRPRRISLGEK